MRRFLYASALGLLALGACTDQSRSPTEPNLPDNINPAIVPAACPTPIQTAKMIDKLFPRPGQDLIAQAKFAAILVKLALHDVAGARNIMFNLVDFILTNYNNHQLAGDQSAATKAAVTTLINALYCTVGLPQPNIDPGALGPDGATAVVGPTSPSQDVVTPSKLAGIHLEKGSVPEQTVLTIRRLPDTPVPLLYRGDSYPIYFEVTTSPAETLNTEQVIGVCVPDGAIPDDSIPTVGPRLRLAHNIPPDTTGSVAILPLATPGFLDCGGEFILGMGRHDGILHLLRYGLHRASAGLADLLAPQKLLAAVVGSGGVGGKTKNFSPFGAVDTAFVQSPRSPSPFVEIGGASVDAAHLPSVKVTTPKGDSVPGVTVTFSSTDNITGAVQLTDAHGIATLTSWTVGFALGSHTVTATATPPYAGTTGVAGSPATFTANVLAGYRYSAIGSGSPPGGFTTGAFDDSGWAIGQGAFGSGSVPGTSCPLDGTVHTPWAPATATSSASSPSNTSDLLLRQWVAVPAGFTGSLTISAAIDNDMQVFVNGTDVTASAGSSHLIGGFQTHDGCATAGSFVFSASGSTLVPGGSNLVVVRARDRGVVSFVDLVISLSYPIP